MAQPRAKLGRSIRRVRRRVALWAAPELDRELRRTKRKLRATRGELREARADLREARRMSSVPAEALPEYVNDTIDAVTAEGLTYLKPGPLRDLAAVAVELEGDGAAGLFVEAGTARGGSAIVIAAAKSPERPMKVYDVFGMIPRPTERDGADVHRRYARITAGEARGTGGDTYYGYRDDLYQEVAASFARHGVPAAEHNVELVQGLFEDTVQLDGPVALAHLDGDWYESTMTCLTRIAPLLVRGGRIVLDDYYTWSGCRRAVDEYFAGRDGFRMEHRSRLHVVRD